MDWLYAIYLHLDAALIAPFRLVETPIAGFYLGCGVLALISVLAGSFSHWAALAANARRLMGENRQMVRMHNLSFHALAAKEKDAFKAANKEANDAFGKYFFAQIALSASFLWPVPFAMGWLNSRFSDVPFGLPGMDATLGFAFPFLLIYILTCILFSKIKGRIPGLARAASLSRKVGKSGGEMMSLSDLAPK